MKLQRRSFLQTMAAGIASLLGLDAAEEFLDRAGPRKVMVPGTDLKKIWLPGDPLGKPIPSYDEVVKAIHEKYRTPRGHFNPRRGALQQEFEINVGWRLGDWIGREGATVGKLFGEKRLPVGCALGPRAKLVFVDEARKTLRFELAPEHEDDYDQRVGLGEWPEAEHMMITDIANR